MTRSKVLSVIVLLSGVVGSVFALDLAKWKYQAKITIPARRGEYCKLILTSDIYDAARVDLGDIRLIGPDGEQISYVLAQPKDVSEKQKFQPQVINRSTNQAGASMITLDFGAKTVKSSVEVDTRGTNFRRAVKVEGSNDNIEFFILVNHAYIFAVGDRSQDRFSTVDLPPNDYRYLRITVEPMFGEEEGLVIDTIRVFKTKESFAERQPVEMTCIEHREDETSNLSVYVYDLGYRHLPISEFVLDVGQSAFYRYVTVEGRDSATQKLRIDSEDSRQRFKEVEVGWKSLVSGPIYRYEATGREGSEKLVLRVPPSRRAYRYVKIVIKNYDDRPLTVKSTSAKMIAHRLIFAAQGHTTATLYVGSESTHSPRYDLAYRLKQPLQVGASTAKVGVIEGNPLFGQTEEKPVAWSESHKPLLLITMGAMVLALAGYMLKSLKSIKREESQK